MICAPYFVNRKKSRGPGGSTFRSLLFKFRDGLDATNFGRSKDNFVVGLQGVEYETVLHFEIVGCTAGIRADRSALRLLNRNLAIGLINPGDGARAWLLSQSRRPNSNGGAR